MPRKKPVSYPTFVKPEPVFTFKWEDGTSYSQGQRGQVEPSTWEIKLPALGEVTVTRWLSNREDWFLHCRQLNIREHLLSSKDLKDAQSEALKVVYDKLTSFVSDVSRATLAND